MNSTVSEENLISCRTSQGAEVQGRVLKLSRHAAAFEIYDATCALQVSEALVDFQIVLRDQVLYAGPATVHNLTNTGTLTVCEAYLEDVYFDAGFLSAIRQPDGLRARFDAFVQEWQNTCKVRPEFKVAISDIQTFLIDLRRWLEQVEVGIQTLPKPEQARLERAGIEQLAPRVVPVIDSLFEKFENIVGSLPEELVPAHRGYVQRHLHQIVLCAPFADRTYRKPLGYAGDYEMVNMMLRDPQAGGSMFAKLFNVWLLHQGSAAAHRNRIQYLKARLVEEVARVVRSGRKARIFNLGCGPAVEVQEFLAASALSNQAQFVLVDFNEETLTYARQQLEHVKHKSGRETGLELQKKSVQRLLKETARNAEFADGSKYDLVYCAGLFDYLPDRTCKHLMEVFYRSLLPGGLALATNVTPLSPNRGSLELILDWHLVYRDAARLATLGAGELMREDSRVVTDETCVNMFLEVRKPNVG
jgi:extracellular factor (EF) 3-hydroxypalmitic acid methyl ester biosynthesis protein